MPQKYIFQNGMPVLNPDFQANSPAPSAPPLYPPSAPPMYAANEGPLTVVSTMEDQIYMAQLTNLGTPQQFQNTINTMQSPAYVQKFNANGIDGDGLIDGLTNVFGQYEIPIGLMSKLTALQGRAMHFKIDNSGSMTMDSNLLRRDGSIFIQQVGNPNKNFLTRWEEAQDRLHIMINLLAYVPTGPITLSFFDHPGQVPGARLILDRTGMTPENFLESAHAAISRFFMVKPSGGTPILHNMNNMLQEANNARAQNDRKTMHYLLSDGEPGNGAEEIRQIKDFLKSPARNAEFNPFTFLGCSNQHSDYAWMHEMETVASFVAVVPDFADERIEVMRDQGKAFPYNRGFWLLCNIAAAINPDDLDALNQHAPFTKPTLENLMGRGLMPDEFLQYFNRHPNAQRVFGPDYPLFLTTPTASGIPSVQLFKSVLVQRLNQDIDDDNDDTEDLDVKYAEQAVINSRGNYNRATQYSGSMYYSNSNQQQSPYNPGYNLAYRR